VPWPVLPSSWFLASSIWDFTCSRSAFGASSTALAWASVLLRSCLAPWARIASYAYSAGVAWSPRASITSSMARTASG
jgi:hypothetical protein